MIMKRTIAALFFLLPAIGVLADTEEGLISEADSQYRAGNFLLAYEAYGDFVSEFPLSDQVPDAQYRRAVSLVRLGRDREALEMFAEIERSYRSTRYFLYVPFWEGSSLLRLEQYDRAVQAFGAFLAASQDPELVPQALLSRAQAELALGDVGSAVRDLETLVREHQGSEARARGVPLLAFAYLRQARASEVLALADQVPAETLPETSRDLYRLYKAEALWALGRNAEAVPLYKELLQASDEVAAVAYRRLFMAVEPEGDLAQMQSLVQQAEIRFAGSPERLQDLWVQIGIESVRQNRLDLADYFLARVWSLPDRRSLPDAVPIYLAEVRLRRGSPAEAASLLEEYLSLKPARTDRVLLRLGEVRLRQGELSGAAEIFERFIKEFPGSESIVEAGYRLAYARFRLGQLDPARELASRLLRENPESPVRQDLYRLLVAVERKRGQPKEAVTLLAAYAELYPQDLKARLDLLKLYFSLKEYAALVAEAGRLQQAFPALKDQDPYAYLLASYLRGLAEVARKQYRNAQAALAPIDREGLAKAKLEVLYPYALYYLAWSQYRLGQFQDARAKAAALLEAYPGHSLFASALYLAGWCSFSLEDYKAAAAYFARLAKAGGDTADKALFLQARSLASLGDTQEASQIYKTLFTVHSRSDYADDALFEYAGLLAERGQGDEAAAVYRDLVQKFPASTLVEEALYKRAEVFSAAKRYAQARDAYYEYRSRFPKGRLVDASLYWGGIASFELGEKFGAVLHWEKLIDGYKGSPFRADALRRTAEAYTERGDYSKALGLLTTLYNEYPDEAKVYGIAQRMEELRYRMRGASDREAALSSVIGKEGGARTAKGREAMIELAQIYIYEGENRLEMALPMLQAVVAREDPATTGRAQYLIGEYYYRKGNTALAAQEYLKAAAANPQDADRTASSLLRAAEMMKLAGRSKDVRELVARLEKYFPGSQWTAEARRLLEGGKQ
jgi:TolA-binding protein